MSDGRSYAATIFLWSRGITLGTKTWCCKSQLSSTKNQLNSKDQDPKFRNSCNTSVYFEVDSYIE